MTIDPLKIRAMVAAAAMTAALALAGCHDSANPDNVDQRSVERWNFLISRKAEKAYDYLTPGFRQTQKREDYAVSMNNRPVRWSAVKFNRKECDADRCKVHIDVSYSITMPGGIAKAVESTSTQSETWILVDGAWFFLPK